MSQGTAIEDELRAMLLMSSLPASWETFVTTVCNASITVVKYSEVTSAILTEAARRKSFAKDSAYKAYVVQGLAFCLRILPTRTKPIYPTTLYIPVVHYGGVSNMSV